MRNTNAKLSIWVLLIVFLAIFSACGGSGEDDERDRDNDPDDGDTDDELTPGSCDASFTLDASDDETARKEFLLTFTVGDCNDIDEIGVMNGDRFYKATALTADRFRRYVPMEEGTNDLSVVLWDSGNHEFTSDSIEVTYSPQAPQATASSGYIHGSVINETSQAPISEATVYVRDIDGEMESDTEGHFVFPTPGTGRFLVTVEKDGFTLGQAWIGVRTRSHASLKPLHLVPLDSKTTRITAAEGGEMENSSGDITMSVPSGALRADVDVSGLSFPSYRSLPAELPDSSGWTQALELFPEGVHFDKPALVRQENINGFPPGFKVPAGYYNRDKGAWEPEGMATVSEDGQWLEFEATHFSPFDLNLPINPRDPADSETGDQDDCNKGTRGSSIVDDLGGQLTLYHPISRYIEQNNPQTLYLQYNSGAAAGEIDVLIPIMANGGQDVQRLEADLGFMGHYRHLAGEADGGEGYWAGARFLTDTPDGNPIPNGLYPVSFDLTKFQTSTYMTADYFGAGGLKDSGVPTREALPFTSRKAVPALVNDRRESPFGAGWSLDVMEELVFDEETGYAVWYRGDRRPLALLSGLPTGDPIVLDNFDYYEIKQHAYDNQGRLYILMESGEIYRAPSRDQVASATLLATIEDTEYLIFNDSDLYAMTDDSELISIDEAGDTTLLWNLNEKYVLDQFWGTDELSSIKMLFVETGAVIDQNGYLWVLGIDSQVGENQSSLLPLVIRVDISGSAPVFEYYQIARLSDWWGPVSLSYDRVEHALYYVFYGESQLRRFDILGLNESFITWNDDFNTESEGTLVRGSGSDSYFLSEYKLLRISPEGLITSLAQDEIDQAWAFGMEIRQVALQPDGTASFIAVNQDDDGVLTQADYQRAVDIEKLIVATRSDSGATLAVRGETHTFDADGRIVAVTDAQGHSSSYTYDGTHLVSYTSPLGHTTTFDYPNPTSTVITDPAGMTRSLSLDAQNHLTQISESGGSTLNFSYDAKGHLIQRSGTTGTIDYSFDDNGSIEQIELDTGEVRNFRSPMQSAYPDKIVTSENACAEMIDGEDHLHVTCYGDNGEPASYSLNGETLTIQRQFIPIQGDQIITMSSGDQEAVHTQVDNRGRIVEQRLWGTTVLQQSFDDEWGEYDLSYYAEGCSVDFYDDYTSYYCNGVSTYIYHDENGFPTEIWDDQDNVYTITCDMAGNVTKITDPEDGETILVRDDLGRIVSRTDPLNRETTYTYNPGGEMTGLTDDAGASFSAEIQRSATCDACETSGVDMLGTITDPFDEDWNATIRSDGRIAALIMPNGNRIDYNYNGNRLLSGVSAAGQEATLDYDGHNRPSNITLGGVNTAYTYTAQERLHSAESTDFLLTRDWDLENQVVIESLTDKATGDTRNLTIGFDPTQGVDTSVTFDDETVWNLDFNYLEDWELSEEGGVSIAVSARNGMFEDIYIENGDGQTVLRESVSFDSLQRIEWIYGETQSDWATLTYTYPDGSNQPSRAEWDIPGFDNWSFGYNGMGRLTSMTGSANLTYTYDKAGRLASSNYAGSLTYNTAWQVLSNSLYTYTYDAAGRRATRTNLGTSEFWRYTYNAFDQLVTVEKFATSSASSPTSTVSLVYDPIGRLARIDQDGDITQYQWYEYTLVGEYDGSGDLLRRYIPAYHSDGLAVLQQGGRNYYALLDRNGSILRLVNDSGQTQASYRYDAYGRVLAASGTLALQPRRFAGALWLESVGLYYLRFRYLDPEIGQFISRDAKWKLKLEPYMYCDGRPFRCTDPLGLEGEASQAGNLARGSIWTSAKAAAGPVGNIIDLGEGLSGYRPGDRRHNASHGMRKVASITFLDKSPTYRRAMDNMDSFFNLFDDDDDDDDDDDEDDPCD